MSSYTNWIRKLQSKERNSGPHSLENEEWDALRAIEAAAPDLLDAIDAIVTFAPQSGMKADAPMLIAARAALAKATGQ